MPRDFIKPKLINEPDKNNNIWCPSCDWHMIDSFNNRRRLGEHLVDRHYKEIAVEKGKEPANLD